MIVATAWLSAFYISAPCIISGYHTAHLSSAMLTMQGMLHLSAAVPMQTNPAEILTDTAGPARHCAAIFGQVVS